MRQVQLGDAVYGAVSHAFAEYATAPAGRLGRKPVNLSFEQAAAVPTAGITALQALRDVGRAQPGQKVLINGASGGVGCFAVQIGKALGAEVTGVCSTRNVEMIRSLGAVHVVDYTCQDFTRTGQQYDLILDNAGNRAFSDLRNALAPQGRIIPNSGHAGMAYIFKAFLLAFVVRQVDKPPRTSCNSKDLAVLTEMIETGRITPVIDRTYPFEEIPEALGYAANRHVRGKVAIQVA